MNPFCKSKAVRHQNSEADYQASNGKAERMHQTSISTVRYGLPLSFWGDVAEYAAYILNRSPPQGSMGRASPIEVLTKDLD